nr:MAG TPA: hypothetical protein [Caudoviricetes sp.]
MNFGIIHKMLYKGGSEMVDFIAIFILLLQFE